MREPLRIQLYTSLCTRNEYYMERIAKAAAVLGVNYTMERVTDENLAREKGISIVCFDNYCPGCEVVHVDATAGPYAPTLVINGAIKCCGVHPSDELLRELLSECWNP